MTSLSREILSYLNEDKHIVHLDHFFARPDRVQVEKELEMLVLNGYVEHVFFKEVKTPYASAKYMVGNGKAYKITDKGSSYYETKHPVVNKEQKERPKDFGKPLSINKNDMAVLDQLLKRTESLPDILHLRAAEWDYEHTEEDKKLEMDTYLKLDDILKELAAFINIKFPGCQRHIRAWYEIDFDTKIGPLKIKTNDQKHIKQEWLKGMFDLKSLIKTLQNEVMLVLGTNASEEQPQHRVNNFNGTVFYNEGQNSGTQNITNHDQKVDKGKVKSIVEFLSWVAGIAASGIAIYLFFK